MAPIRWMSFYQHDPAELAGASNLAIDHDLGILAEAAELGYLVMPDVSRVFLIKHRLGPGHRCLQRVSEQDPCGWWQGGARFETCPNCGLVGTAMEKDGGSNYLLRPDAARSWAAFWPLVRDAYRAGLIPGFFLGDELIWMGVPAPQITQMVGIIRASVVDDPPTGPLILYLNEAAGTFSDRRDLWRHPNEVTRIEHLEVTHISVDHYWPVGVVRAFYEASVFPLMASGQRAFLVPQAYASVWDPHESSREALAAADGYFAWAVECDRIDGIFPWHWLSYWPCGVRNDEDAPINNTIGVRDTKRLRERWTEIGREIVGGPEAPHGPARRMDLRHDFNDFADGEGLPSIFADDPEGHGVRQGLGDPVAPDVGEVCFSRAVGGITSIWLKGSGSTFRYQSGNVQRAAEDDPASPRRAIQAFRCEVWFADPTKAALVIGGWSGTRRVAAFSLAGVRRLLRAGEWNQVELLFDRNASRAWIRVNGAATGMSAEIGPYTVYDVKLEGGPCWIAGCELRSGLESFARREVNRCSAFDAAASIAISGPRIAALDTLGNAFLKDWWDPRREGEVPRWTWRPWEWQSSEVVQMELSSWYEAELDYGPRRFGVVQADGKAWVKEGEANTEWTQVGDDVVSLTFSWGRIGTLTKDGVVFLREGLEGPPVFQTTNAAKLVLDGLRVGVLYRDGNVLIKDGPVESDEWVQVTWDARDLVVDGGGRVGVIHNDGRVHVKEGPLDAPWVLVTEGEPLALGMAPGLIGVLHADGRLFVKQGPLGAGWQPQRDDVRAFALDRQLNIAVLDRQGNLFVKDNGAYGDFGPPVSWDVASFAMTPRALGVILADGSALVKRGPRNGPWEQLNFSALHDRA